MRDAHIQTHYMYSKVANVFPYQINRKSVRNVDMD